MQPTIVKVWSFNKGPKALRGAGERTLLLQQS
jgi:hypothetical protein